MGHSGTQRPQREDAHMSHVKLSVQANVDLARLYEFLAKYDFSTADKAIDTLIAAFDILEKMPLASPPVVERDNLRKLVIPWGQSGYIAFYSYDHLSDTVIVACILHQKETYDTRTVGWKIKG
jgi:plasmid stabilization system protein ParE